MADLLAELESARPKVDLLAELQSVQPTGQPDTRPEPGVLARAIGLGSTAIPFLGDERREGVEESVQAGVIGAGRGLTTVMRGAERLTGADISEPTTPGEEEAFAGLKEEFPTSTFVGEIAGESAPFLIGGIANVPAKLLPRLGAAFGLGAVETATITAGKGKAAGEIAGAGVLGGTISGAFSLAFPVFSRVLSRTLKRITGKPAEEVLDAAGNMSAEIKKTLDDAGITPESIQDEAVKIVRDAANTKDGLARLQAGIESGEDIAVTARATLFDDLGIPTVRSRIQQTPEDFLGERTLARQIDSQPAQELRERLAAESQGFTDTANKLADDLGLGPEAGKSIKTALEARRTGEKAAVTALYQDLSQASTGRGIPLVGDEITKSLQDDSVRGMVGRLSQGEIDGLNDRLIEFGIDADPSRVANWAKTRTEKAGGLPTKTEVTPLNVLNFNEFRKSLNSLLGPDSSDELRAVAGKIKEGLDNEIDVLEKSLKQGKSSELGDISLDVIQAAKRATEASRLFKAEFGPDKVVNLLIKPKRGSFDEPQILSSELVRKMLSPRDRIGTEEAIESIAASLRKSGKEGQRALGDLQSATALDLLDFATKAKSGKLDGGVIEWSGVNFGKRFDAIGERRLSAIFQGNPQALNMLKKLRAAGDLKTEFKTVAKSSGTSDDLANLFERTPFIKNLFSAAGGVTAGPIGIVAGEVVEKGLSGVKSRQVRKAVKKRLDTSPVLRQQMQTYRMLYPNLMAVLGVESVSTQKEKK